MKDVSGSLRTGLVSSVLLIAGIIIGLVAATDLGWTPFTKAQESPSPAVEVAIPFPVPGVPSQQPLVEVARDVTPAVVNISTTRIYKGREDLSRNPFFEDPLFRRFFGDEFFHRFEVPQERREQSLGSGVIIDPDGFILTNNHVVSMADEIKVFLGDRREFKGKIVGNDPKTDLAIIKIDASELPSIPWGDSSNLQVGELVLAVGNPFGLNQTVTMGIISAVGRANVGIADYEDFIQTDAAINPGNSGGALVNLKGELIGINTAIYTQSGGYMGVGFAVPSNMARLVMESLISEGRVVRGWLGIIIQDLNADLTEQFGLNETRGALVSDVLDDSPAQMGGLQRGDVILELNEEPVENVNQLRNRVAQMPAGSTVRLTVIRDEERKEFSVTIGEQPKDLSAAVSESTEMDNLAFVGIQVEDLTTELIRQYDISRTGRGVVVTRVREGSRAEQTGIRMGDVILEINRVPVHDVSNFEEVVSKIKKEDSVLFLINRQRQTLFVSISGG